jgi:hypothetical protein
MDEMTRKKEALQRLTGEELCRLDNILSSLHQELIELDRSLVNVNREFRDLRRTHEQLTRILELDKGKD